MSYTDFSQKLLKALEYKPTMSIPSNRALVAKLLEKHKGYYESKDYTKANYVLFIIAERNSLTLALTYFTVIDFAKCSVFNSLADYYRHLLQACHSVIKGNKYNVRLCEYFAEVANSLEYTNIVTVEKNMEIANGIAWGYSRALGNKLHNTAFVESTLCLISYELTLIQALCHIYDIDIADKIPNYQIIPNMTRVIALYRLLLDTEIANLKADEYKVLIDRALNGSFAVEENTDVTTMTTMIFTLHII